MNVIGVTSLPLKQMIKTEINSVIVVLDIVILKYFTVTKQNIRLTKFWLVAY